MIQNYDIKNSKWSEIQKECYERNCICKNCYYQEYNKNCSVKYSLMKKIKLFGLESEAETKQWL